MKDPNLVTKSIKLAALCGSFMGVIVTQCHAKTFEWVPDSGGATGLLVIADVDATPGSHTSVPLSATFDPDGPGAGAPLNPIIGFYPGILTPLTFGFKIHGDSVLQEGFNLWASASLFESHSSGVGEATITASGPGLWKVASAPISAPEAGSTALLLITALSSLGVVGRKSKN